MGWILFLTAVIFFGWILWRRYIERSIRETIEWISQLGKASFVLMRSSFWIGVTLIEIHLYPKTLSELETEQAGEGSLPEESGVSEPEMVFLPVHRIPESGVEVQKYLGMRWLGRKIMCEVRPLIAEHSGVWHYAEVEIPSEKTGEKPKKVKIPAWTLTVPGDLIGVVEEERKKLFDERVIHRYFAPSRQAYLSSFEIHEGTRVEAGDVVALFVIPVESLERR